MSSRTKLYAGRRLFPQDAAALSRSEFDAIRALGILPVLAGGQSTPVPGLPELNSVGQPDVFGVSVDADGRIVVDDFTNPITRLTETVRAFAADNEGYWIEQVFNAPGGLVTGGAVQFAYSIVGDHFLPDGQTLRPRAPGAEAPRVSGSRRRPTVAYPESISASLEVTDEGRQRNRVVDLITTLRQIANTFTLTFQDLGEAALEGLVAAGDRIVYAGNGTYADWEAAPRATNITSNTPLPAEEFDEVILNFVEERGGVRPDTIVWSPQDRREFYRVYRGDAPAVLAAAGLTRQLTSVRREAGRRLYLRSGQVGTLMYELPLGDPEFTREGTRKTDVYTFEARPVFVANGADAVLEVRNEVAP